MSKTFEVIFKEFADSETFVMSRALLEDYKAKAAQETEERIIKLLETHAHDIPTLGACYDTDRPDFIKLPREDIDELIADIKGENK